MRTGFSMGQWLQDRLQNPERTGWERSVAEVSYRPFRESDLAACARISAEAWPYAANLVGKENLIKFMRGDVGVARESTWLETAAISDRPVGFLFGKMTRDFSLVDGLRALVSSLVMALQLIMGKYGSLSQPLRFLKKLILAEMQYRRNSPAADAEVLYFVVESKHRGRGIGRTLMDRFVHAAKDKEAHTIILGTDDLSSWQFYEEYGFTRYKEFHDDFGSYASGTHVKAYIYVLET